MRPPQTGMVQLLLYLANVMQKGSYKNKKIAQGKGKKF